MADVDEEVAYGMAEVGSGASFAEAILAISEGLLIELMASAVHDLYVKNLLDSGVTSRKSALTGEETLVEYDQLSPVVKDQDRVSVRAMLGVLPERIRLIIVREYLREKHL